MSSSCAILVSCGDEKCWGRVVPYIHQHPKWGIDRIFLVTGPGINKTLTEGFDATELRRVKKECDRYDQVAPGMILAFAAGHLPCGGNKGNLATQARQLYLFKEIWESWTVGNRNKEVVPLLVNEKDEVQIPPDLQKSGNAQIIGYSY